MHKNKFVVRLLECLNLEIEKLSKQISGEGNTEAVVPPMPMLLKMALKNEWETSLLTSFWVTDEPEPNFRVSLAQLAGDEAKHFNLIKKRLDELGGSISKEDLDERTPLFHFLKKQMNTFDRIITGPFAREALAVARNKVFLNHCEKIQDQKTIEIYKTIQEDEKFHHELGLRYADIYLKTQADLDRATEKMLEVLKVVDDIQEMIVMKKGLCQIPGC